MLSKAFLQHAAVATSQYDALCRELATEVLRLRETLMCSVNLVPLRLAVKAILDNASAFSWSVQGFGLLRLYIGREGRLHIWDSALRYPGVSMIHTHSWDLMSTIVSGQIINRRYVEVPSERTGEPYHRQRFVTGYQGHAIAEVIDVHLAAAPEEMYYPGDNYTQRADEIHETVAQDGTITLMARKEDENSQADLYWPRGTPWGTAVPRPAIPEEVSQTIARALRVWQA